MKLFFCNCFTTDNISSSPQAAISWIGIIELGRTRDVLQNIHNSFLYVCHVLFKREILAEPGQCKFCDLHLSVS